MTGAARNPTRCEVIGLPPGMAVTVCQACGWHQRGITGMRRRTHCPGCGCSFSVRPARHPGATVPRVEFIELGCRPFLPGRICDCPVEMIA